MKKNNPLLNIILFVAILVLIIVFLLILYYKPISIQGMVIKLTPIEQTCTDSDGDDILTPGEVTITKTERKGIIKSVFKQKDACYRGKVREYTCKSDGKNSAFNLISCPAGYSCVLDGRRIAACKK